MATPFALTARALDADDGRAAWWIWGVAMVLMAAWCSWFLGGRVVVHEVSLRARLEVAGAALPVMAAQGGSVARVHLGLGREVKAGDLLVELDDRVAAAREAEAEQLHAALPARLLALRGELSALQQALGHDQQAAMAAQLAARARTAEAASQLDFARDQERRLGAAAVHASVAEVELARARADARRLQALHQQLLADEQRLARESQARVSQSLARQQLIQGQMAALEGEQAQAAAALQRARGERERLRVRAPVDGQLAETPALGTGAWVAEGQRVATVLPHGALQVVALFEAARALGRVKPGQRAWIRLDGYAWTEHGMLQAEVARVGSDVRDGQLQVELRLPEGASLRGATLQHGLTGTVEVALESVAPATLLLRSMGQLSTPTAPQAPPVAPAPPGRAASPGA